ncbi:unnamed protein product [Protopolystoma xenopodis]|uniref:Uncharacterized protein n=1 Tax=Protopolystoma xenopodis TaxID=117903 RepID=A0A3S4ZJM6_9PLAT|nr:unnamed protein product [Protopolystoma xenopodis]
MSSITLVERDLLFSRLGLHRGQNAFTFGALQTNSSSFSASVYKTTPRPDRETGGSSELGMPGRSASYIRQTSSFSRSLSNTSTALRGSTDRLRDTLDSVDDCASEDRAEEDEDQESMTSGIPVCYGASPRLRTLAPRLHSTLHAIILQVNDFLLQARSESLSAVLTNFPQPFDDRIGVAATSTFSSTAQRPMDKQLESQVGGLTMAIQLSLSHWEDLLRQS